MSTPSTLSDAELVQRCRDRRLRRLERARRALLAIRLRDLRSGLPAQRRGRRGRVPGRLHAGLHASRHAARRLCAPAVDRAAHAPAVPRRDLAAEAREQPVEEVLADEGSADMEEVEEAFAVREALAGLSGRVPGHPRPLLRPRPELPDDRGRARHSVRNDRQPHRALPATRNELTPAIARLRSGRLQISRDRSRR